MNDQTNIVFEKLMRERSVERREEKERGGEANLASTVRNCGFCLQTELKHSLLRGRRWEAL